MATPLPRQPECPNCGHEQHLLPPTSNPIVRELSRCGFDLGGAPCPCPPHLPPGIYDQEASRG